MSGLPGAPAGAPPPLDFSKLPQDDLGPKLRAVVWVLTAVSSVFLALRLYCKWMKHRGLYWDDWVLIAAWLSLLGDAIFTTLSVGLGFGKHAYMIPLANVDLLAVLGLCSVTFAIVGQAWSKTSFALTLLRISDGWMHWVVWFTIISLNILFAIGALFFWVGCTPLDKTWKPFEPGTCWDPQVNIVFGIVASAYSGIMDLLLAALPWKIILTLQMKREEKLGVALAMSMGIFAAVAAFIKCSQIPALASGDFTYDGANLVIWGAAETAVTIMAASIPVMRVLVRDVAASGRYHMSKERRGGGESGGNKSSSGGGGASGSGGEGSGNRGGGSSRMRGNSVTVVSSTGGRFENPAAATAEDDLSDKSILDGSAHHHSNGSGNTLPLQGVRGGGIVQTSEVTVEYRNRRDGDPGYMMGRVV